MTLNHSQTELWRTTRLGAKRLPEAISEITRQGATGSLTIHFHEGQAGSLEFKEKLKVNSSPQKLDKKSA